VLEILKGGDGIPQILNDAFAHVILDAVPNHEQTGRGESGGDQQHGEQKARPQPSSGHQRDGGLLKGVRRGFG
jgi:hypothetical protein